MSRIQLALNVGDLDAAIDFYQTIFGVAPAKRRPGYANFTVADPPLKLVLLEHPAREPGTRTALNHLGVELESREEVSRRAEELGSRGLATTEEPGVTCCYARQDKVWVRDPDGAPWEFYTVLADAPDAPPRAGAASGCCASSDAGVPDEICC